MIIFWSVYISKFVPSYLRQKSNFKLQKGWKTVLDLDDKIWEMSKLQ